MIVVSDTSPLAYLVQIGVADFLPKLYGKVFVPVSVAEELQHDLSPAANWMTAAPDWLHVATPQTALDDLTLDVGEREAIALALELGADQLLMDERQGRDAAKAHGLKVAGTLAVIIDGVYSGLIDGNAALDRLMDTNFYASASLIEAVRQSLQNPRG